MRYNERLLAVFLLQVLVSRGHLPSSLSRRVVATLSTLASRYNYYVLAFTRPSDIRASDTLTFILYFHSVLLHYLLKPSYIPHSFSYSYSSSSSSSLVFLPCVIQPIIILDFMSNSPNYSPKNNGLTL